MLLFGDMSDGDIAIISVLSTIIGGGVTWFVTYLGQKHDKKRKEVKEDEKTIVDHLKEVEERCNEENRELKADLKYTNRRLLQVMNHLMYLEGILETKGIKFKRIEIDDETSVKLSGTEDLNNVNAPKSTKIKRPGNEIIE